MNLDDVRAFVAVVDMGSVGRAALRLNLTQPAVSRRVQRLEETLGVTLLDRESKPARPTRAGEAAYGRCLAVLRATEALTREASSAPAGPLRIGVSSGIAESVFAPALDALRASHPATTLHLSSARSIELNRQVGDGQLDAAVVLARPDRPPAHAPRADTPVRPPDEAADQDQPSAEMLGEECVVVVAGAGLVVSSPCRLADLAGLGWVINPDGCGFRAQLDRALAAAGQGLEVSAESWGITLQIAMVARGAGLGLVPERLIAESPHRASLRVITVEDFHPTLRVWLVRSGPLGALAAPVNVLAATVRRVLAAEPQ
jgi:DNA-binding transcriptional LysR family regulator